LRRILSLALSMLTLLCLSACTGKEKGAAAAAEIAEKYSGTAIEAEVEITADYGERVYIFSAEYAGTAEGGRITVLEPANIAGVSARIENGGAVLVFEGVELNTGALADGDISPMSALTGLMAAWSAGSRCSRELLGKTESLRLETPYGKESSQTTWFDESTLLPLRSEIISEGRAVLIITFKTAAIQ